MAGDPARTGHFWEAPPSNDEQLKLIEEMRKLEEAKARQAEAKQGVPIPPKPTALDGITLEYAMPKSIDELKRGYLVEPFLPENDIVGFYGRGSTSKSSFVATMAAGISEDWSTLWISVEEDSDWITQRHIEAGGEWGTLGVFKFEVTKRDAQGRVVGSTFNIYQDLESSILKAQIEMAKLHDPPRPLRLVVLDTAVGLTTWSKGESPNSDADVKRLMAYLRALAAVHKVTIAIIGHTNKGKHEHFADVVAGAGAWTTSPRLSFVHARDRREEHAFVMRVAKTNLGGFFAATYRTEPVLVLHTHADGHEDVLCKVVVEPVVWGDEVSLDLWDEATAMPKEDGGGGDHKVSLVENVMMTVVELVHTTGQPVTRDAVHTWLGREVTRREWVKVALLGEPRSRRRMGAPSSIGAEVTRKDRGERRLARKRTHRDHRQRPSQGTPHGGAIMVAVVGADSAATPTGGQPASSGSGRRLAVPVQAA